LNEFLKAKKASETRSMAVFIKNFFCFNGSMFSKRFRKNFS